ncbi:MAG TPA: CocE/NonD family hydrolase [Gemmatimonadales bacterium]
MIHSICAIPFLLAIVSPLAAQRLSIPAGALADSSARGAAIPRLAQAALADYRDSDRAVMLDNQFRLYIVAGQYDKAAAALAEWRAAANGPDGTTASARARNVQYEIYLQAKQMQASGRSTFADAFRGVFRERFRRLDDRTSALVARTFNASVPPAPPAPSGLSADGQSSSSVSLADGVAWLRAYQIAETYLELGGLAARLIREDDRRRYIITTDVRVRTRDGATICAMVWRPRKTPARRPALLQFTIYADSTPLIGESRRTVSNGYAAVIGFTRGKMCSPDAPVPYVHDGADASTLIGWISRQSWSDGRVGMYGGSYSGMTAWAAAKHLPPALKAIMVGAPVAPALDVPMEGNIAWNFVYPWPFYTTGNKTVDDATYNDRARWRRVNHEWYVSGRAYRDLDKIDGTPNPVWDEWLAHPAYDRYWQAMIPSGREFGRIRIPVLQTAGYYYGGPGAAIHYLTEHYRYNPKARHYLLIGPYDHFQAQRGVVNALADTATVLSNYEIDPAARIDIVSDLRYQWFDYALKGGPRPALLADKVNYEVVGANRWKHTPSIAAMSNGRLRFHLSAERAGDRYRLTAAPPSGDTSVVLTVNLADRSDSDLIVPGGGVADTAIDTTNALVFASEPLPAATEVSGLFSGHLDFVTNKKDFDFVVGVYEQRPDAYLQLPPYQSRASHVASPTRRRLLTPGARERLDFTSIRLASHLCEAGSRLVVVLGVPKSPNQQINYGTGKDVSDETIADAGEPLSITWFSGSYIELPVWRSPGAE